MGSDFSVFQCNRNLIFEKRRIAMHTKRLLLFLASAFVSLSFTFSKVVIFEFEYPTENETTIKLESDMLSKFESKWRDEDYYCLSKPIYPNGIKCSVLYSKLSKEQKAKFVDGAKAAKGSSGNSPIYALEFFSNSDKSKNEETNRNFWGKPTDDFMFRQADVSVNDHIKLKHMYAFAMVADDIFVNVHLSKKNATAGDSIFMRSILSSVSKIKR